MLLKIFSNSANGLFKKSDSELNTSSCACKTVSQERALKPHLSHEMMPLF